jgi:hypothetical protein
VKEADEKVIGFYAGTLGLAEVGLGSLLHGMKVPLTGTFLSLNQALFLTRVVKLNRGCGDARWLPMRVSSVTALLKSLSPAGKKLLPMLAISAQGLLFSIGTTILGPNIFGVTLGAALLAIWGVFQPLAILLFVYGIALGEEQLARLFEYYSRLLRDVIAVSPEGSSDLLWKSVVVFAGAKMIIAGLVCAAGWRAEVNEQELVSSRLVKLGLAGLPRDGSADPGTSLGRASSGALRDLFRPVFVFPLIMTGVFFWFAEHAVAPVLWGLIRPLAAGYLLYLAIRLFPVERWVQSAGFGGTALAAAIDVLKGQAGDGARKVR